MVNGIWDDMVGIDGGIDGGGRINSGK